MAQVALILLVLAFLLTGLCAFGVGHPRINLGWLGVSIWILTVILGGMR